MANNFPCEQIHILHQSADREVSTWQRSFCVQELSPHLEVAFHHCSHTLPSAQEWDASALSLKVPCCESIPRQGALLVAIWCRCLCLWCDPKQALLALGKGRWEVEWSYWHLHSSLTVKRMDSHIGAIPLGHTWCFQKYTEEEISLKINKISQKFTRTFCMTSASVLNHPAYPKLEGLDLSGWHVPSCHGRENTGTHLAL